MKLHLGCGARYIPGFIHIDLATFPHIDYRHDIRSLPMFSDNSAELIYCCHGIEYFGREEIGQVFVEWRRVLKRGGILRLAMPDFDALVNVYRKHKKLDLILGPLYGRWVIEGKDSKIIYHKTVYNFSSLKGILQSSGFTNIRRYDWRKTIHKDYDDYSQAYIPHRNKGSGILISLNVQARKI